MIDLDGVTVRSEPWSRFWPEAQDLIREHTAEVVQREDKAPRVNADLFARLDAAGILDVSVGRLNGRMFGYLLSIVHPSLEDPEHTQATQTSIFVRRDARGAGIRLFDASLDALRARGVREVHMRAGVVGSGPKLGALYRRRGAVPHGELYSLMLKAA